MDPMTAMIILGAASSAAGAVSKSRAEGQAQKQGAALTREQLAAQKAAGDQDVALKESLVDPYRQQMQQGYDIGALDRLERANFSPVQLQPAGKYAGSVPQMSGGFSYEKSPELVASAGALKRNVMGGNTAPTMTNPANYGKSASLNLLAIGANGVDPGTVNAASAPGGAPVDYTEGVEQRGRIGTLSGRKESRIGLARMRNSFKADSAPTDYDVAHATQILTQAIQQELGRAPQPGEIDQMLASQGLKPGDRFVGSKGLNGLLAGLQGQGGMRPSYIGQG